MNAEVNVSPRSLDPGVEQPRWGRVAFASLLAFIVAAVVMSLATETHASAAPMSPRPPAPPSLAPSLPGLIAPVGGSSVDGHVRPPKDIARLRRRWHAAHGKGLLPSRGFAGKLPGARHGGRSAGKGAVTSSASTLVLYDTTGPYGWLGELYGMYVANLTSHFGSWTALPVASYTAGMVDSYSAVVYIGSTYDEPLPASFISDVKSTTKPVVWMYDNIWQLTNSDPTFTADYGWQWKQYDTSDVPEVDYKGTALSRSLLNRGGIMDYWSVDPSKVTTLATAKRADGTTFPWALRSRNLTYIGEIPFSYTTETDRDAVFSDLLFDALAPNTPERHRAMIRLEDINPESNPTDLTNAANVLYARHIPFGFGVSPQYMDPNGASTPGVKSKNLALTPKVITAIKYLQSHGGTMVEHGYTHQYSNVPNPYNAVSGDDFEFYRTVEKADHTLDFQGPVPEDKGLWAAGRMTAAGLSFMLSGLKVPSIFEFPHYTASVNAYKAAAAMFPTRWERAMYFSGQLSGNPIDYSRPIGQRFPYPVRDVYGSVVLPENIGSYEPEPFFQFPIHTVNDILAGADANKVVRDGFASFYYHPFWGTAPLTQALDGLTARGWTFVAPTALP